MSKIDPTFSTDPSWISLPKSVIFIVTHVRILLLSILLFLIALGVTWIFYAMSVHFLLQLKTHYFPLSPDPSGIWGWIAYQTWSVAQWIFTVVLKIAAFYLAFVIAYCLTSPGYSFLSAAAENIFSGQIPEESPPFSLKILTDDLIEAIKIGLFGVVITGASLFMNFIPLIGQGLVFFVYSYYSCLMFIDYPASRRRWPLGIKLRWLGRYPFHAFRIGFLPAAISIIPILNIFLLSLFFPILTVYSTLNFHLLEALPQPLKTTSYGH